MVHWTLNKKFKFKFKFKFVCDLVPKNDFGGFGSERVKRRKGGEFKWPQRKLP
jgi:hypothetical protein